MKDNFLKIDESPSLEKKVRQAIKELSHDETFFGILEELREFRMASEFGKSRHLPEYTEAQEELADVLICCLTELHRRGVDVERIIKDKVEFNKTRV